ncbi:hypothetical protein B0H11DRAFT_1905838 [Mycena galericulata]|nr:hypothetical protein B0H11DRAFT_1905838 [Mycena galericulata]
MNKEDATFDIVAEQYVSATKSTECFPTHCLIPDTPHFKKFKPVREASGTPAHLKFTGFLGSQGTNMSSGEGPALKKRKTANDHAAEEANDKGELRVVTEDSASKSSNRSKARVTASVMQRMSTVKAPEIQVPLGSQT